MTVIFNFCILLFLSLMSVFCNANPIIFNNNETSYLNLEKNIGIYVDTNASLTIDSLLHFNSKYRFTPIHNQRLNYGFTKKAFWLKISSINNSSQDKTMLLSIAYPLLNSVVFYETDKYLVFNKIVTGELCPFDSRGINNRKFVFPLKISAKDTRIFYIRVFNDGETVRIPLSLSMVDDYNEADNSDTFWIAIYYGFLLFGLIFNLLLFISFKNRVYLYFSVFVCATTLSLMVLDGLAFQLFYPALPWLANKSIIFVSLLSNIAILLFTRNFYFEEKKHKIVKFFSITFLIYYCVLVLCIFLDYPYYLYVVEIANITTATTAILILTLSLYSTFKKFKSSKMVFASAFVFVMLGTIFHLMRNSGLMPDNFLTQNGLKLGFAFQIIVLTFAIVMQFKMVLTDTNKYLELEVKQRTAEIEAQRDFLDEQKIQIQKQNEQITDSIKYAQRIQNAALPDKKLLKDILGDYFILNVPRYFVSGDFYWVRSNNGKIVVAVVDCTGHGVPGGFLSMLGISFLNEIVVKDEELKPSVILDKLRVKVKNLLSNNEKIDMLRDGMDMALCVIDKETKKMEFACAYNSIFVVRNNDIIELIADKMPIGVHSKEEYSFTNYEFQLKHHDKIYLFTDGIVDQFGGPLNKKFSKSSFKSLLKSLSNEKASKDKEFISKAMKKWQGASEQTDDILVLGFSIS